MQFRLCNMMETDCSTYLMRVRAGSPMTQFEQTEAWSRQRDQLRHNFGSRVQYEDSHGSSQASSSFPCSATVHGPTSQYYTTAGNVDNSLKLDQVLLHIYYYHKQDMIQLLRSAILECLEGHHQLADRIQGWYRGHRYRPTQVSLCFIFRFLHVMMKDTSVR